MSDHDELSFTPESFSGRVRLFPLPNLVMFPHVMQPLHIFEPRYRELMEDAISDDRLIALATFQPGWEANYEGRPALGPVACLGRVATFQRLPNGKFNLLLLGVRRVRLLNELPAEKQFRQCAVEVLEDIYSPDDAAARPALQHGLIRLFKQLLPKLDDAPEQLDSLLSANVPLGMLTDIVAYSLDLDPRLKESLLQEVNVDVRARLLLKHLHKTTAASDRTADFPPNFSVN